MSVNEISVTSRMASAMGARISITGPGQSMYLVIGNKISMGPLVKSAGGEVVLSFNGAKMLVTLPFTGYLALKGNREISHIGPVTVDLKRLTRISETLAKAFVPGNGNKK
jgi:hypothetical protein